MNKYTTSLKELYSNFSYYKFLDLLNEIDSDIIDYGMINLDAEFLWYFNGIMNFINDDYVVDGEHITLGNMLFEQTLSNKEKITPSLLIYLYLDKKKSLELEKYCNYVVFTLDSSMKMGVTVLDGSSFPDLLHINWKAYKNQELSNEEFNYVVMHDLFHELTHIYQGTRLESSSDLFEKLVFYDNKIDHIIIRKIMKGSNGGNPVIHDSMLNEFVADENADVYMLEFAKRTGYFNKELIQKKLLHYQQKKSSEFYMFPRYTFEKLLDFIKDVNIRSGNYELARPILEEISGVQQQIEPILEQLKLKGISENSNDSYYNIFLKSLYRFDGNDIIIKEQYKK